FSTLNSTLPAAQATGHLTLRPHSVVRSLIYNPDHNRVSGVHVVDALTMKELEFEGRMIFLCASTLESTRILLNSATSRYPNGLANSSGVLGHYLMDHLYGSGATGIYVGMEEYSDVGRRPNGIYIPRFQNVKSKHPKYLRGYGFQGRSHRAGLMGGYRLPGLEGIELP